ncbi:MAG: helix-turn-helix domain-containing protein [Amaricoccus sp.]
MRTDVDTTKISAGQSLTVWRDTVCANLIGVECDAGARCVLKGRFTQLERDGFAIARLRADAHNAVREQRTLRKSDTDFYVLFLQKTGVMRVRRENGDFLVRPGDMYFYDAGTEHQLLFDEPFDHLAVRVPRKLLERRWSRLAEIGSFRAPADERVIDRVLLPMAGAAIGSPDERDLPNVAIAMIDLFAARVQGDAPAATAETSHARLMARRIGHEVDLRLEDPALDAEAVGRTLGLSRRQVDRLLERCGTSFARILMGKRLRRAAELLEQPWARGQSVTQLALAAGFENHSFFSRKFREAYGLSPRDYREAALGRVMSFREQK